MLDAMSDRKNPVPFLYQLAAGKNLHILIQGQDKTDYNQEPSRVRPR